MKNTVKLDEHHSIVTQPMADAELNFVLLEVRTGHVNLVSKIMTPDQCSGLIFGLEQALEALATRREVV